MKCNISAIMCRAKRLFFIGIGGVSMSSLAIMAKERGYDVSGSDRSDSAAVGRLRSNGITVYGSHDGKNIAGADAVIFTAAISADNPERRAAEMCSVPQFTRAEFLGYLMLAYTARIGVCGMHGKSTTTSMISHIYIKLGANPTVVNGADMPELNSTYRLGGCENFIFEACEYTDSFLSFYPTVAVVLNIDYDHPDYFESMEHIIRSFHSYIGLAETAVVNADDKNVALAAAKSKTPLVTFGLSEGADFRAADIETVNGVTHFTLVCGGREIGVTLPLPGTHMVYNAIAAIAAASVGGLDAAAAAEALADYSGTGRRMQVCGCVGGVWLCDDYAHHPTEIKASLEAIGKLGYRRIFCVYQPHTYSRTDALFSEFVTAFDGADRVIFTDVYAAREVNTTGITSKDLADRVKNSVYIPDFGDIVSYLAENVKEGDLILSMGAGDVNKILGIYKSRYEKHE